jgi:predicted esterase
MDELDPERRLHCYLPQGPVHINNGRYSWDDDKDEIPPEVQLAPVAEWLDALPYERKVLAGWSQGGWLTYFLGLGVGRPRQAGLMVLGARFWDEALDLSGAPEVLIAHRRQDESVDVEHARRFKAVLEAAGVELTYLETEGGHRIDDAWLPELRAYLSRVI